jgi:hypothetical protein
VHHNAIAIIARNPKTKERLGISVKSGSATMGTDCERVSISDRELGKVKTACTALKCVPYIALLIEQKKEIWIFFTTLSHLLEIQPYGTANVDWNMTEADLMRYLADPEIMALELNHKVWRWW